MNPSLPPATSSTVTFLFLYESIKKGLHMDSRHVPETLSTQVITHMFLRDITPHLNTNWNYSEL